MNISAPSPFFPSKGSGRVTLGQRDPPLVLEFSVRRWSLCSNLSIRVDSASGCDGEFDRLDGFSACNDALSISSQRLLIASCIVVIRVVLAVPSCRRFSKPCVTASFHSSCPCLVVLSSLRMLFTSPCVFVTLFQSWVTSCPTRKVLCSLFLAALRISVRVP
jgi:hypothetical protein